MFITRVRLAVAVTAGVAASAALVAPTTQAAEGVRPPIIYVHITAGHTVRMVDAMRPGVHRFTISSAKAASFQLAEPRAGYTKRMAAHDIRLGLANNDGSPKAERALRRFERHVTLFGGIGSAPGQRGTMWVDLPRGHFWALDTTPSVPAIGDFHDFTVGGARLAAVMPRTPVVRAIDEATWAKRPRSIPRAGLLTFSNQSTDDHFLLTGQLPKGKTIADFAAWVKKARNGNPGPPPLNPNNPGLNTGVVSPGHAFAFAYAQPRGRYVMFCFWPDAEMHGTPHVFMGMFREINVGI